MQFNLSQAVGSCAGILILGSIILLTGAGGSQTAQPASGTIDVQRVNIREPDGTLRLVISNAARAPGIIVKGHEQPHPTRQSAGFLFFNDEGTENGGLIFDGSRTPDGVAHSSGSLTFDRYEQDQIVQILGSEDGAVRSAGLIVNDQPEAPFDFVAMERARHLQGAAQHDEFVKAHAGGVQRAFIGRAEDKSAEIVLRDKTGAKRLVLRVGDDGRAEIAFYDAKGAMTRKIGAESD
jgi:hypothetical protein